jgi:hypothetical protein
MRRAAARCWPGGGGWPCWPSARESASSGAAAEPAASGAPARPSPNTDGGKPPLELALDACLPGLLAWLSSLLKAL